ncbi:MAG TPA: hypothetical protein VMO47_04845 [Rhodothermales bacterium]|nr:hypothetical protein [Rhodothermales bacterium]
MKEIFRKLIPAGSLLLLLAGCRTPHANRPLQIPQLDAGIGAPVEPELLAPGIISTGNGERDAAFTPDHSEFYYTLWTGAFGVILQIQQIEGGWSEPETAPFSGRFSDLEPFVTHDGNRLFFASNRPVDEGGDVKDYDIWFVERQGRSWGHPIPLGAGVNTPANEFYPSLDREGNLYFTAAYEHSFGGEDIWMSRPEEGGFGASENVGPGVNTEKDEFNSAISPDGSFLVFSSFGREDGLGGGDLYISFRDETGALGTALNAGADINSASLDFSPALTPDGRTFIFSSRRTTITAPRAEPWTYEDLIGGLNAPENGDLDIYRVDAAFIERLSQAIE